MGLGDVYKRQGSYGRPWRRAPCLKCLDAYSEEQNIARTMDLISNMDEPMDEVLLSSVVEACVRIRKPELLSTKLEQLKTSSGVSVTGSHTFSSSSGDSSPGPRRSVARPANGDLR